MDEVIVIEILDRAGRLKERTRVSSLPATIGRSWRNDVIVDDRYVSPEHLRVVADEEGRVFVEDRGSTNGLWIHPREKVERALCERDSTFRIGHSLVRIRRASDPVEPALVERRRTLHLDNPWASIVTFAAAAVVTALFQILDTHERIELKNLALGFGLAAFLVLVWAGGWALAGRVIVHQARLREHATIAALTIIAFSVVDWMLETAIFAAGADAWTGAVFVVAFGAMIAANFYGHLGLVSLASPPRLARSAILVSTMIVGLVALAVGIGRTRFSPVPSISPLLKPPAFRLAPAKSAETFLSRARALKDDVDEAALEP